MTGCCRAHVRPEADESLPEAAFLRDAVASLGATRLHPAIGFASAAGLTAGLLLFGLGALLVLAAPTFVGADDEAVVVDMQEISMFDWAAGDAVFRKQGIQGQYAFADDEPSKAVKKYPKLKSSKPKYGMIRLGESDLVPGVGQAYYFVLDESADAQTREPEKPSLLNRLARSLFGGSDEEQPARKYDWLYIDANRDLDLTNDAVVNVAKVPPRAVLSLIDEDERDSTSVFDEFTVQFDYGRDQGTGPLRIVPLVQGGYGDYAYVRFLATTARKGEIRIGSQQFTAVLAQPRSITGRFDQPFTGLFLRQSDGKPLPKLWWGSESLGVLRNVDDRLYRITATPRGDKLTVAPYQGDFGVFEVRSGERSVDAFGASGVLLSKQGSIVTVGDITSAYSAIKTRSERLPVGDYEPLNMSVAFGKLEIDLSPNYGYDQESAESERKLRYPISISKDEPFVLDFSGKPSVVFTTPRKDSKVKPGSTVQLEAVMVDPVLGLMITDVKDTARKLREFSFEDDAGNPVNYISYASLDPQVVIADSAGKQVAKGKMPFG